MEAFASNGGSDRPTQFLVLPEAFSNCGDDGAVHPTWFSPWVLEILGYAEEVREGNRFVCRKHSGTLGLSGVWDDGGRDWDLDTFLDFGVNSLVRLFFFFKQHSLF